jgi:hypothetical protein
MTTTMRMRACFASSVYVSLGGKLFFKPRCSKRNAVCVDSRRALMRHPPCSSWLGGQQMAKRRKKAAAKKTKKRKKKL